MLSRGYTTVYDGKRPRRRMLTLYQQLLEIWNKAKGKERDIMLWGDEVRFDSDGLSHCFLGS